mmetsp:Transcript_85632/g.133918  ORF Transcript_85632/g.133918 Transcript_85632/m.133918 type:complete len:197 (-) Transcript_85632:26-616(-)
MAWIYHEYPPWYKEPDVASQRGQNSHNFHGAEIPGYAGHIPGKKAENVHAATFRVANDMAIVTKFDTGMTYEPSYTSSRDFNPRPRTGGSSRASTASFVSESRSSRYSGSGRQKLGYEKTTREQRDAARSIPLVAYGPGKGISNSRRRVDGRSSVASADGQRPFTGYRMSERTQRKALEAEADRRLKNRAKTEPSR